MPHTIRAALLLCTALGCLTLPCAAQATASFTVLPEDCAETEVYPLVPAGFLDEVVVGGLNQVVGFTFAPDGRTFFWQKQGRIMTSPPGGGQPDLFFEIVEEVGGWAGHGLLGFALDPDFLSNGHFYLLYGVDHHYLMSFGTPGYDPNVSSDFVDTIGRVTRYTADAGSGFTTVDPNSRLVLLGETASTGIPLCSGGHSVGDLMFGNDGSLLISAGDGASAGPASQTCLSDGITRPAEEVSYFRAQLLDSLSGKMLRIDPSTGDGLTSNPHYDVAEPRAPRSRIWALGLRNPFRFDVRPGTGQTDPALGLPGSLFIGDVGKGDYEELNVARVGGLNFGWPVFEGFDPHPTLSQTLTPNLDAPNPLFGINVPGAGVCTQEFYDFQDLVVQETLNMPFWSNPCAPAEAVSGATVYEHARAAVAWHHDLTAYVPIFDGSGEADSLTIDDPASPVVGMPFTGNASMGGAFYTGDAFPAAYKNTYFHADYGKGWIHNFVFDADDRLLEVREFAEPVGRVVHMEENLMDGALYYMDFTGAGVADFRRIRFVTGNQPPSAEINSSPPYGPAPVRVQFDGTLSADPEGGDLSYAWDFGPNITVSTAPRPVRTFPSEDVTGAATQVIARIFQMNPPMSMGTANQDPEVMRDGVFPPEGTLGLTEMFDTVHVDGMSVSDKGGIDWVGYEFPAQRVFTGAVFQEGLQFPGIGGWFDSFTFQVRRLGDWVTVSNLQTSPPYSGELAPSYERFDFSFDPSAGNAIRILGVPGGVLEFLTIAEFRVMAWPLSPNLLPTNIPVELRVTDIIGAVDTDNLTVSSGNTPPELIINSPQNFELYSTTVPQMFSLEGVPLDAEHSAGELGCSWQLILHHDTHNHPGPVLAGCTQMITALTDGCVDVHYQELVFSVSDPLGLVSTESRYLIPDCDQDLSGVADDIEIGLDPSLDLDLDGVPDAAQLDCNLNGEPDLYELFFGLAVDADGDGMVDDCVPGLPGRPGRKGSAGPPGSAPPTPGGVPPVSAPPGVGPVLPAGG